MRRHHFYDPATGLFTGRTFSTSFGDAAMHAASLEANTPAGNAHIEGAFDHLSQRVDVATGQVVDYQPPAPSAEHEWNAATRRWQLTAAAKEREQKLRDAAARAQELNQRSQPLLRQLAIDPSNADARAQLKSLHDQINALEAT